MNMNVSAAPVLQETMDTFARDMAKVGHEVEAYQGRWFYDGPAVFIEDTQLQDVIRATSVQLQWDELGKTGLIVYPR